VDRDRSPRADRAGSPRVELALRALAPLTAAFIVALTPSVAAGAAATAQQVRELARDATFDDAALRRLEGIDEIDGRPVDLDRLLHGATGTEIAQRVETLLRSGTSPVVGDTASARAQAREILSQDRYQPDEIPRPFRGPLEWIAARLEPVADALDTAYRWVADFFRTLASGTPGGVATLWTILGLAIVAAVATQTKRAVERRGAARATELATADEHRSHDPRDLERQAAAARARGDHELAIRLLFRAGLLRLIRARAIPARDSLTTGEIRRLLRSAEFDRIGTTFDEIAYGRRPATDADARAARDAWSQLLHTRPG